MTVCSAIILGDVDILSVCGAEIRYIDEFHAEI